MALEGRLTSNITKNAQFTVYFVTFQQEQIHENRNNGELLNINLRKDSSLLLHAIAIHSPFNCRILRKIIPFSIFYNPYKNPRNKKTWVYSWIAFCRT